MSDLSHLEDLVEHQDRGSKLTIIHPVTGEPMPDMVFVIAGPDSNTQRLSRLKTQNELLAYRSRPSAEEHERLAIDELARFIIGWDIKKDGEAVQFTFTNVVRLLKKYQFIREQIERHAASRAPYFAKTRPEDE